MSQTANQSANQTIKVAVVDNGVITNLIYIGAGETLATNQLRVKEAACLSIGDSIPDDCLYTPEQTN